MSRRTKRDPRELRMVWWGNVTRYHRPMRRPRERTPRLTVCQTPIGEDQSFAVEENVPIGLLPCRDCFHLRLQPPRRA